MTFLFYDNTFEGLLTAVFEVYERRLADVRLCRHLQEAPQLFAETLEVVTSSEKAARVGRRLIALLGPAGAQDLWKAWLLETDEISNTILGVIRYAVAQGKNILEDYGHIHVLHLHEALRKIGREKHRMEAFVRFSLTGDGLYYAVVDPDFNVLPLIAQHFSARYADQRWIIYDSRRQYGLYYDLTYTSYITPGSESLFKQGVLPGHVLHQREKLYQSLWKDYFDSTNIGSRKNTRLHLQHVPRRYWKYLTEKNPGPSLSQKENN